MERTKKVKERIEEGKDTDKRKRKQMKEVSEGLLLLSLFPSFIWGWEVHSRIAFKKNH